MAERRLDALVTVFTGQLSGWYFLPPFNRLSDGFFPDPVMLAAEELFVGELGRVLARHDNVIGFDMGNEINTCWSAKTEVGDAWMERMFARMNAALPGRLHVNGVDHWPWFGDTTFSQQGFGCGAAGMPVMHRDPYRDRRGEVWGRDGPAQREVAGGSNGGADFARMPARSRSRCGRASSTRASRN